MESLVADPSFWKGKRVFLTGHTGFKGSWLSLWLASLGAKVCGYSLPAPTRPSLFEVARVAEGIDSMIGDVRDFDGLSKAVAAFRPEVVLHLAAQPLVRAGYDDPRGTYDTNVMGTVNLLQAIRLVSTVRAVVVVTSDKCYENREWSRGYRENDPMGGSDPYSSSKGCAELITAAFRHSFFNGASGSRHNAAIATARAGNVLGGGDWSEDRLVPDLLRAIAARRPLEVRHPNATRPWQHVLESLSGYLRLAEKLHENGAMFSSAWNFGPSDDESRSVSWLVDRFIRKWGDGASWKIGAEPSVHEATYLRLDSSRSRALLGWRPRLDIEHALQWVIDWHRAHASGQDMRAFTLKQISMYSREAELVT